MRTDHIIFMALSDPTRRAVLNALRDGPRSVGDLARGLPVTRSAVSQHLKVLGDANLVMRERAGTRNFYQINYGGLATLRDYIEDFWRKPLAAFRDHAEKSKGD